MVGTIGQAATGKPLTGSPAPAVTEEEVEAALAGAGGVWGTHLNAEAKRWLMREALGAAARVRVTMEREAELAERQLEALSPWSRAWTSFAAGLCMCHACVASRGEIQVTMHLCPKCGNKRCPKAESHAYRCTGSNTVGQVGELEKEPASLAHVSEAFRAMPSARRDLDRMSEAIRALPGAAVMGRAIGADR